jgi:uncharacterized SAM-binding protein YcdF (DUF218 family)
MKIILHLGGDIQRAETAAQLAASMPNSTVVVSSEGDGFYKWYDAAGIARERIIVDTAAWDTLTNFTHTYKLLKSLNCSRLYVVTSFFHCYRSMLIALACWGGRVPVYMVPHGTGINEQDEGFATVDFLRASCWRLFGLVFFFKKTRQERQSGHEISDEHGREIGF